jgi:hypothetical protein
MNSYILQSTYTHILYIYPPSSGGGGVGMHKWGNEHTVLVHAGEFSKCTIQKILHVHFPKYQICRDPKSESNEDGVAEA